MDAWRFFLEFIKRPKSIGAIWPSSNSLARRILADIEFSNVRVIVEFGSGTGVFTQEIVKRTKQGTVFLAFETNPTFSVLLRREYPGLDVVERSAVDLAQVLQEKKIIGVDVIISGLPFALFDEELQEDVIRVSADALNKGGTFRTFAYIQSKRSADGKRFRSIVKKYFDSVTKTNVVWMNLPPAFLYVCKKGAKAAFDDKTNG